MHLVTLFLQRLFDCKKCVLVFPSSSSQLYYKKEVFTLYTEWLFYIYITVSFIFSDCNLFEVDDRKTYFFFVYKFNSPIKRWCIVRVSDVYCTSFLPLKILKIKFFNQTSPSVCIRNQQKIKYYNFFGVGGYLVTRIVPFLEFYSRFSVHSYLQSKYFNLVGLPIISRLFCIFSLHFWSFQGFSCFWVLI